ncbi:group III truncated hemoglobin [Hymenobacter actinosclerus]|uniref:Hemoglobin n=1 Tax=Hymenobacter actinosclerus TaxID=82805 RepID=A0A1I0HHH1_9BACT|nr:group III truncated hemoglobin [Hymenobacter actinosclerus]SET83309.1 hemoglobin [Hymenobacter actinosclerus]
MPSNNTLPDIQTEADIKVLVDSFYDRVNADPLLGPVFNEVAQVNWAAHLPRMYDFWSGLLLHTNRYQGQPFAKHIPLPIGSGHFQQWLHLFCRTVDSLFAGPVANEARLRAGSIAHVFESRMRIVNTPLSTR